MAAETVLALNPKETPISCWDDPGKVRITRIYALGGFVVTEFVNFKTGKPDSRVMKPHEAMGRARAIAQMPKEVNYQKLIQAIVDAASQAQRQINDGEAPILDPKFSSIGEMTKAEMDAIQREVEEARKKDPELDEEMRRAEFEAKRNGFTPKVVDENGPKIITPGGALY